jgi:predicted amidophosphoribosyltransferase
MNGIIIDSKRYPGKCLICGASLVLSTAICKKLGSKVLPDFCSGCYTRAAQDIARSLLLSLDYERHTFRNGKEVMN